MFQPVFRGDVTTVLSNAKNTADLAIRHATEGNPKAPHNPASTPLDQCALKALVVARDAVKKEVGIDAARQKKYDDLRRLLAPQETNLKRLEAQIVHALGTDVRRRELITSRKVGPLGDYRVLICDRDWSRDVRPLLFEAGIRGVRTPFQAPNANACAEERFVRSLKEECLDRVTPLENLLQRGLPHSAYRQMLGVVSKFVGR